MSVFAIADLHLSFGADKPMDVFPGWANYTERLRENWSAVVNENDTVVIAGDISWAMDLRDTVKDFSFIDRLPGKKLLLKGNHDYWWTTKGKMDKFISENGFSTLSILHNNYIIADGLALCGSRGWFYDAETDADMKVLHREVGRLKMSIEPAVRDGFEPIVFLHYPPVYNNTECCEIMDVLRGYGIKKCFYGHIHGGNAARRAFIGDYNGISMKLISCDHLRFTPLAVL